MLVYQRVVVPWGGFYCHWDDGSNGLLNPVLFPSCLFHSQIQVKHTNIDKTSSAKAIVAAICGQESELEDLEVIKKATESISGSNSFYITFHLVCPACQE